VLRFSTELIVKFEDPAAGPVCVLFVHPGFEADDLVRKIFDPFQDLAVLVFSLVTPSYEEFDETYQAAAEELRMKYFANYIPVIEGDIAGRERKPDPAPVRAAMKALGAQGQEAVYIGDTEVDMQTALNSGIDFIAVAWGYRTLPELQALGIEKIAIEPMDIVDMI